MFFGGRARNGVLHFYPEIFNILSSFSTFASKVSYSGIKQIYIIGPNVPKLGFRVVKRGLPKGALLSTSVAVEHINAANKCRGKLPGKVARHFAVFACCKKW